MDMKTLKLNATLALVDDAARKAGDPAEQCGVLFMAHVLAVRRLLAQHSIADRGRRLKVIKASVAEFESKLRQYARIADPPVFIAENSGLTNG